LEAKDKMFGDIGSTMHNSVVSGVRLQRDKRLAAKRQETQPAGEPDLDLSHALRTRLTIVTLISENLDILYDQLDDEKRRKLIRDLCLHTRRLNDLACDLLAQLP
jgi:hypothetical protein